MHVGPARPDPEKAGQIRELRVAANGVNLYTAVIEVAGESMDAEARRFALDEIPKTHSLHTSTDNITPS